jgi:hypothetical protein
MSISGISQQTYIQWLQKGGTINLQIEATDISSDLSFESSPDIKPNLYSGFELIPSSAIMASSKEIASLLIYGDFWTRVVTFAYSHNGKIVYMKLPNGKYQVTATAVI